tara:strand:+ start:268 stop:546 length:279 start_codon:yes stop_codon:yes gene_type:complete
LDYEEELADLRRQRLHYQGSTGAHVSVKDELLHEVDIEVFVKVRQIYFLASFGNVKRTEQILVYNRLFLLITITRNIALVIFTFFRAFSILN